MGSLSDLTYKTSRAADGTKLYTITKTGYAGYQPAVGKQLTGDQLDRLVAGKSWTAYTAPAASTAPPAAPAAPKPKSAATLAFDAAQAKVKALATSTDVAAKAAAQQEYMAAWKALEAARNAAQPQVQAQVQKPTSLSDLTTTYAGVTPATLAPTGQNVLAHNAGLNSTITNPTLDTTTKLDTSKPPTTGGYSVQSTGGSTPDPNTPVYLPGVGLTTWGALHGTDTQSDVDAFLKMAKQNENNPAPVPNFNTDVTKPATAPAPVAQAPAPAPAPAPKPWYEQAWDATKNAAIGAIPIVGPAYQIAQGVDYLANSSNPTVAGIGQAANNVVAASPLRNVQTLNGIVNGKVDPGAGAKDIAITAAGGLLGLGGAALGGPVNTSPGAAVGPVLGSTAATMGQALATGGPAANAYPAAQPVAPSAAPSVPSTGGAVVPAGGSAAAPALSPEQGLLLTKIGEQIEAQKKRYDDIWNEFAKAKNPNTEDAPAFQAAKRAALDRSTRYFNNADRATRAALAARGMMGSGYEAAGIDANNQARARAQFDSENDLYAEMRSRSDAFENNRREAMMRLANGDYSGAADGYKSLLDFGNRNYWNEREMGLRNESLSIDRERLNMAKTELADAIRRGDDAATMSIISGVMQAGWKVWNDPDARKLITDAVAALGQQQGGSRPAGNFMDYGLA